MKEQPTSSRHGAARHRSNDVTSLATSPSNADVTTPKRAPSDVNVNSTSRRNNNNTDVKRAVKHSPRILRGKKVFGKNNPKYSDNNNLPSNDLAASRSNTASPASGGGFSDANDAESDAEWDVGVGNLVIDLDADIERSSAKVNPDAEKSKPEAVSVRNKEFVALLKSDSTSIGSGSSSNSCDLSTAFPSLHKAFLEAGGSFATGAVSRASTVAKVTPAVTSFTQSTATQHGSNALGVGALQQLSQQPKQQPATTPVAPATTGAQPQVQKVSPAQPAGASITHPAASTNMSSAGGAGGGGSSKSNSAVASNNKGEHSSLKMKIKRTKNSSSRHGAESKHEIVKDKNLSNAQNSVESASNHAHGNSSNNVNSSSNNAAAQPEKVSKHHHHSSNSNSVDSNSNSGKSEGSGKSSKSGRNSQKKNKDKNKNSSASTTSTNASTQSNLPDMLANGSGSFHGGSTHAGSGSTSTSGGATGNTAPGTTGTTGGTTVVNPSGGGNSNMPGVTTNVSVELDRLALTGTGNIKKEPGAHARHDDPYEFNAKVEDRPLGLPAMKKIKVEKVRISCFGPEVFGRGVCQRKTISLSRLFRFGAFSLSLPYLPGKSLSVAKFSDKLPRTNEM